MRLGRANVDMLAIHGMQLYIHAYKLVQGDKMHRHAGSCTGMRAK